VASRGLLALASTALLALALEGACRWLEGSPAWAVSLPPRAPGATRVVLLGGSTVRGTPVPELGFAAQLEALLRRRLPGRALEIVNLGQDGSPSAFVRRLAEHVAAHGEPDALVVLTAHNEFLNRSGEHSRLREWALDQLPRSAALRVLAARLSPVVVPEPMPARLAPVERGAWFERRLARYRENLDAIARAAEGRGVPLLLLTAPANLADWPPVHRDVAWALADRDYEAHVAEVRARIEAREIEAAARAIADWRERFGEDAMFEFLAGQVEHLRGRADAARAHWLRAVDLDPIPWRALTQQNQAIRALSGRHGARIVDLEAAMARAAGGRVGFEWIGDNVHPTPLGSALAAGELARALAEVGLWSAPPPEPASAALEAFLAGLGARAPELERARRLRTGLYCMKTPFYHYTAARSYLEAALELAPGQWVALANLGTLSLLEGDRASGLRDLRRAGELRGAPLDPADLVATPYLAVALARAGVSLPELPLNRR
jgi:tetratricopeptide (TPR) repeat protein